MNTYILLDNLECESFEIFSVDIPNFFFDANGKDVTCKDFFLKNSNRGEESGIIMGSGTWETENFQVYISEYDDNELVIIPNTSVIKMVGEDGGEFKGGGKSYNDLWITEDTQVSLSGINTLSDLRIDAGANVSLGGEKVTLSSIDAMGTSGSPIFISDGILFKSSGTVVCDYLSLEGTSAEGGAIWYAGRHSIDRGGNSGWIFSISSLIDNFNDNSLDTNKWNYWGDYDDGVVETKQQLELTTTMLSSAYFGIISKERYNIESDKCFIEVINAGNPSMGYYEAYPLTLTDTLEENAVEFNITEGNLNAYQKVSGINTRLAQATYNLINHRFLQLREDNGTIYWETSSDRENWNVFYSVSNPIDVTQIHVRVSLKAVVLVSLIVDNLNILPDVQSVIPRGGGLMGNLAIF